MRVRVLRRNWWSSLDREESYRMKRRAVLLLTTTFFSTAACDLSSVDPRTEDVLLRVDSVGLTGRWADSAVIRLHFRLAGCEELVKVTSTAIGGEHQVEVQGRKDQSDCDAFEARGVLLHAIHIPATSDLRVAVRQPDGSPDVRFVNAGTSNPPPPRCGGIARVTGIEEVIAGRSYALGFVDPCADAPYALLQWSVADTTIARVTPSTDSTAVLATLRSGQTKILVRGLRNGTVVMSLESPLLVRAP
jgi:hypothetical protein